MITSQLFSVIFNYYTTCRSITFTKDLNLNICPVSFKAEIHSTQPAYSVYFLRNKNLQIMQTGLFFIGLFNESY